MNVRIVQDDTTKILATIIIGGIAYFLITQSTFSARVLGVILFLVLLFSALRWADW